MNKFLWSCAALLTLFVTVEALRCYTCDVSILGSCTGTTAVNCSKSDNMCFSGVLSFSADRLPIYDKGCIMASACKNVTNEPILNINYTIIRHCCNTDLCNGVAPVQLPATAALGAALVALWSQWVL
ncbi:sperm acrosome membrane-associated protein 4-like [Acanthopagrus latus]|uniref:sperm acrosome membrane-associated protein 4-like n=1 Tax=Acanthopagrus latus TaxID=8177 RepID=UPI00187C6DFB|nr:sperm acrosome membrane-associated protein 4-like [Acanthopagrus latus]XP_036949947.1 sperm acrosome membrane-associated protein 4-like [Acanthopagrus latus]